jgi:hypothetical protein
VWHCMAFAIPLGDSHQGHVELSVSLSRHDEAALGALEHAVCQRLVLVHGEQVPVLGGRAALLDYHAGDIPDHGSHSLRPAQRTLERKRN